MIETDDLGALRRARVGVLVSLSQLFIRRMAAARTNQCANSAQASDMHSDGCILSPNGILRLKEFLVIERGSHLLSASPSRKEVRHGANLA